MQALAQATDNLKGSPAYADVFGTTTAGPVRPYEQLRVCAAPKDLCRGYIHRCTRRGKDSARILRPARQNPVNGRGGTFGPRGLVGEVPCHSEKLIRVRIALQKDGKTHPIPNYHRYGSLQRLLQLRPSLQQFVQRVCLLRLNIAIQIAVGGRDHPRRGRASSPSI